jgi:acid stress-induced BolA-like protein IbaG/YrbA
MRPQIMIAAHTLDYGLRIRRTPMDPRDIAQLIEQHLPGAKADVQTDGQGHYEARVICAAFAGKRSLQRHQMVYGTLGTRVGREIHALALETFTPEEWQARSA